MKDRKKPAIRFKGFTEDWEQRKLGEICQVTMGQSPDGSTYSETPSDYILVQGNADLKDGWVSPRIWTTQKTKTADAGDLIMSVRAPAGAMGKTTYNVVIGRGIAGIKGNEYIYQYLVKMDLESYWKKLASGSTFESIKSEDINRAELMMPRDIDEQDRIGEYFRNLNHLITLHQRKYDKLVNIKKSMLEKMFPRDGKIVSDIRFSGFTEDWEQRKVGEFLTESRIRGNTGLDAMKLTVKLWGKGVVEKNDFGGSEHTQYFTRRKGQFIYSKLDFLNSAFGVIPEKLDNYESTADLPAFDLDGMNPYFMYFVAIQESFYLKHGSIADGSRKAKRIHADTFLNMPVMVPTIDEQNLIVDFLQHLDNLITLHQRKLEKLKNIKKSCLEKMFI